MLTPVRDITLARRRIRRQLPCDCALRGAVTGMSRNRWVLGSLIVLSLCGSLYSQSSSGILASARAIDWSAAGAGSIPTNRTQCGATLAPGTSAASIQSAITSCSPNTYVLLGPGTFNLSAGIQWSNNNVSLRGSGPDSTFLVFSANANCNGLHGNICVISSYPNDSQNFINAANWTGGYAQGTTSITIGANTSGTIKPNIGTMLVLDQLNDGTSRSADTGNIFICSTAGGQCTQSNGGNGRSGRNQQQIVKVTSVSAGACPCTVGISPGLYMPNWRSSQAPQAWWTGSDVPTSLYVTGAGIEDLSIDTTNDGNAQAAIVMFNATNSWIRDVRSTQFYAPGTTLLQYTQRHVRLYQSTHITIRDSYFFGSISKDEYGINFWESGDNLIENNIFQRIGTPINHENAFGNVIAYNYTINNYWCGSTDPTNCGLWAQGSIYGHGTEEDHILIESNDGHGMEFENYFGQSFFITAFRNRFTGYDSGNQNQTVAAFVYGLNRYLNLIGNVLGVAGYHNTYQTNANGSTSNCVNSVYSIGLGANCANGDGVNYPTDDPLTVSTLMRWGNWDVVTNAARWCSNATTPCTGSEVPSGLTAYANPIPASQTLPASFYLASKPAFWGSQPWPAIGPEVNGGDVPNVGGHAYRIPARVCFENVLGGTFGDTAPKTFNASKCYSGGGGTSGGTPPAAPTGVQATVQ